VHLPCVEKSSVGTIGLLLAAFGAKVWRG
jgi:hypothetical protein